MTDAPLSTWEVTSDAGRFVVRVFVKGTLTRWKYLTADTLPEAVDEARAQVARWELQNRIS
jgi:hypothetical protein